MIAPLIIFFIFFIFALIIMFTEIIIYVDTKKPIDRIRRQRIERLIHRKVRIKNIIYNLQNATYKTAKKRDKAKERIKVLEEKLDRVKQDLNYLNNYGVITQEKKNESKQRNV